MRLILSTIFLTVAWSASAQTITFVPAGTDNNPRHVSRLRSAPADVVRARTLRRSPDQANAEWNLDGVPSGRYRVEVYCDQPVQAATFNVESLADTTEVPVKGLGAGRWQSLGEFDFLNSGRVTQVLSNANSPDSASAIRLVTLSLSPRDTVNSVPPAISMTIDDLGNVNPSTYAIPMFTNAPNYTYAIIPFLTHSVSDLQQAASRGVETITHMPMQYEGQNPDPNLEPTRLYTSLSNADILTRLRNAMDNTAPYTVGMNNHQGSVFTPYRAGMEIVIDEMIARDQMFFLDSRTIASSVAWPVALEKSLLSTKRDAFLDGSSNTNTRDLITAWAASAISSPNISWNAIAHERVNSVQGIIDSYPLILNMGIEIRKTSEMCIYLVESDFQPEGASFVATGSTSLSSSDLASEEIQGNGNAVLLPGNSASTAKFSPNIRVSGDYRVFVGFTAAGTNCDSVHVLTHTGSKEASFVLNQQIEGNRWHYIGTHTFHKNETNYVQLDASLCTNPAHQIRADAVKFQYDGPPSVSSAKDWTQFE